MSSFSSLFSLIMEMAGTNRRNKRHPEPLLQKTAPADSDDMIPAEILLSARQAIGPVEGHELDDQQVSAILNQAHNHLVAAGAGTGKTTAILGKIRYLLASGMYEPEEILVLSYTRNAAEEMKKTACQMCTGSRTCISFDLPQSWVQDDSKNGCRQRYGVSGNGCLSEGYASSASSKKPRIQGCTVPVFKREQEYRS